MTHADGIGGIRIEGGLVDQLATLTVDAYQFAKYNQDFRLNPPHGKMRL